MRCELSDDKSNKQANSQSLPTLNNNKRRIQVGILPMVSVGLLI